MLQKVNNPFDKVVVARACNATELNSLGPISSALLEGYEFNAC